MSENIYKQLLTREIKSRPTPSRKDISYTITPTHNSHYGYVTCRKHDCLTCFLKTYKGCHLCKKDASNNGS